MKVCRMCFVNNAYSLWFVCVRSNISMAIDNIENASENFIWIFSYWIYCNVPLTAVIYHLSSITMGMEIFPWKLHFQYWVFFKCIEMDVIWIFSLKLNCNTCWAVCNVCQSQTFNGAVCAGAKWRKIKLGFHVKWS